MPGLLSTLGRLDEAQGSSRGVPNWALTHPPAADRVEKVQERSPRRAPPAARRRPTAGRVRARPRRPRVRRQPREGHRARQRVPAPDPALRAEVPARLGDRQQRRAGGRAPRRGQQRRDAAPARAEQPGLVEQTARADMTKAGFRGIERRAHAHQRPGRLRRHLRGRDQNTRVAPARGVRSSRRADVSRGRARAGREFIARRRVLVGDSVVSGRSRARRPIASSRAAWTSTSVARRATPGNRSPSSAAAREGIDARDHERPDPATPPRAGERLRIVVGG